MHYRRGIWHDSLHKTAIEACMLLMVWLRPLLAKSLKMSFNSSIQEMSEL